MRESHKYSHKNSNNMEPITEKSESIFIHSHPLQYKTPASGIDIVNGSTCSFPRSFFYVLYICTPCKVLKQNLVAKG